MKKYAIAFLASIPIILLAWNLSDYVGKSTGISDSIGERIESSWVGVLQETDEIIPKKIEVMDVELDIISSGWYKYFLEQQEYISNISNGQCSYEIIGEDECEITLYDKEHVKVFSEVYPLHHSWVKAISGNILEIGLSVGSPARYTFYFDTETAEISDTYFNAKVFGDQYIAYMDSDVIGADEITLTLTDIFEKGILHQEVVRDFSVCADPMSAVYSVEMVDDNSIRLEYCGGEDYTTVSEIIELEWTPMFSDGPISVVAKLTLYNADGSIKTREEYEYDSAGNKVKTTYYNGDGSMDSWDECEYDGAGNETKWSFYNADGNLSFWFEYEYDSAGNKVKTTRYNGDDSVDSWEENEYDSMGNEMKHISYNAVGGINAWVESEYDSMGNKVKYISYNANDSIKTWCEYEYNRAGQETKWIYYLDGRIYDWIEYEYDNAGNHTKSIKYNSNGDMVKWHEWEFDNAGRLKRQIQYYPDGSIVGMWIEYKYDSTGNCTELITHNADDSVAYWNEIEYDSAGNKVKTTRYNGDGSMDSWEENEYDSDGNRTKEIEYSIGRGIYVWNEYEYITITPFSEVTENKPE